MRILVLSDTHGDTDAILQAIDRARPDAVIHLGDCIGDMRYAMLDRPDIPYQAVAGNCDYYENDPYELTLELGGLRIFALHGHTRNVKDGDAALLAAARAREAAVVLYGHTHCAREETVDGILLLNPGSARRRPGIERANSCAVLCTGGTAPTVEWIRPEK